VIATFVAAIAAGATREEASILSNHAAGIVVGKVGAVAIDPAELVQSF
jgi:D-beta-D-heptose 7-phosphate kinase/D-beta-D-heptose 1-phosphate adenosyltransferase